MDQKLLVQLERRFVISKMVELCDSFSKNKFEDQREKLNCSTQVQTKPLKKFNLVGMDTVDKTVH